MHVIHAVNVNDAYRQGMRYLAEYSIPVETRNGAARRSILPVTTVYAHPMQRVLFDAPRDANPFFHLFESLWMLAGRNDLASLELFLPRMRDYSDDGSTLNGAYGYRWRHFNAWGPDSEGGIDQLARLVRMLKQNPGDRRAMLAMWDPKIDLNPAAHRGKDLPCNTMAKFDVFDDALNLYVFNRSNDAIWGCYGANAVHFAFLLEYVAAMIGQRSGSYYQLSMDFHAYESVWSKYWTVEHGESIQRSQWINPYLKDVMQVVPLVNEPSTFDRELTMVTDHLVDGKFAAMHLINFDNVFFVHVAQPMFQAFRMYRSGDPHTAAAYLRDLSQRRAGIPVDWHVNAIQWLMRRKPQRQEEIFI